MGQEAVTAAARLEYSSNVQLSLQQNQSRLKGCATYQPNLKGKSSRVIELFGAQEGDMDLPRGSRVQPAEGTNEQVWCKPRRLNTKPHLLEKEDEIKNMTNYSGSYVQSDAATLRRMEDRVLSDALWSARIVGEDGTATEAYSNPNGFVDKQYVFSGAAADSGLNIPKLVKGLELLEQAEVDVETEEIFLQVTSKQVTDLYNDLKFINQDYRDRAVLDDARKVVREILGIKILRMPDAYVLKTASTRRCMLFAKSGLHYGEFSPVESTMGSSIEHYNRILMYSEEWIGATRSEDAKFVPVDCYEA